jgi:hypothetical protein
MKKLILAVCSLVLTLPLFSKEGMWIPLLLEKYNITEMQQMGFKLTASDVYDVNHASMKDAVVLFGRGCTGEIISGDGLLITNYHCGLSNIQSHSSVEHDYLADGFWAKDRSQELANRGLSVSILEYMEDVSGKVLDGTADKTKEVADTLIRENIKKLEKETSAGGKFEASVKPLFYGNQYFLYVYKVFKDVRLVGAPPSAIGKFGGDTDNWIWPRHTGDFALFRIYAGKDNEPAAYSENNVPYKPKKFFPVSMKGIQPGDFTMVFGFPGSTMEYIPSQAVNVIMNQRDPDRIKIRDKKLEIIYAGMEKDQKTRIQYTAKANGISNSWKKWQGEIKGLKRLDAVNQKLAFEKEFKTWAQANGSWESAYKKIFDDFESNYRLYSPYIKASDFYSEAVWSGAEIFGMASSVSNLIDRADTTKKDLKTIAGQVVASLRNATKDIDFTIDEQLFAELLPMLSANVEPRFIPSGVLKILNESNPEDLVDKYYRKSLLANIEKLESTVKSGDKKKILAMQKDPLITLYRELRKFYNKEINPVVNQLEASNTDAMKIYMAGIMEMRKGKPLYADANLTLRVAYGKVEGYKPADGVVYNYKTTLKGIIEKDNPEIFDYDVPDKLKQLYESKDFGPYAVDGEVPVCFVASNHTTGGNSGSPVVNAEGQLIGVNFDRCWEGTMSDIQFDPDQCRNIILDIRYALFIIDKLGGAGYLLDEMELVK